MHNIGAHNGNARAALGACLGPFHSSNEQSIRMHFECPLQQAPVGYKVAQDPTTKPTTDWLQTAGRMKWAAPELFQQHDELM